MSKAPIWPNFFIVGVGKAGTTSLYEWLKQHPQIYMCPIKEPHYFAKGLVPKAVRDERMYLKLFDKARGYKAIGEASTSYFRWGEVVAERIKEKVPKAKIIIILRDPVERAYSDWLMHYRRADENKPFYDALVLSSFRDKYIQVYTPIVKRYLEEFPGKVLILMFEDLKQKPRIVLRKIAQFLQVDEEPMEKVNLVLANPGGAPRAEWARHLLTFRKKIPLQSLPFPKALREHLFNLLAGPSGPKPPIDPRAIEFLRPIFEADLRELEKLLGRPLPELRRVW